MHLALLVRVELYDEAALTRDDIAEEFLHRGWCNREQFDTAWADLEAAGRIPPCELVPNTARHTGAGCQRCAEHTAEFELVIVVIGQFSWSLGRAITGAHAWITHLM